MDSVVVRAKTREFVVNNFIRAPEDADFRDSDSFMECGIVDSTGVLELVGFLEGEFGFVVEDEELRPANLDSLDKLVDYVGRKIHVSDQTSFEK